jgi:hypothetical protein
MPIGETAFRGLFERLELLVLGFVFAESFEFIDGGRGDGRMAGMQGFLRLRSLSVSQRVSTVYSRWGR